MDIKIANIINLFQKRNFTEAKLKCLEVQNSYENNPEFLNIFEVILFDFKEYNYSIENYKNNQPFKNFEI